MDIDKEVIVSYSPSMSRDGSFEIPQIRLRGKWLKEALGVKPGDKIRVKAVLGVMSIYKEHDV